MMQTKKQEYDTHKLRGMATAYLQAINILDALKRAFWVGEIDLQQMRALKEQALNGDITGATQELAKLRAESR